MKNIQEKLPIENEFPEKLENFEKVKVLIIQWIEIAVYQNWKDVFIAFDWHIPWISFWLQKYQNSENTKQALYIENLKLPKLHFVPKSRFFGLVFENTNLTPTLDFDNKNYFFDLWFLLANINSTIEKN